MTKRIGYDLLAAIALFAPSAAAAQNYTQFPAPIPWQRAQHSYLSGAAVVIPPYPCPFPIRVYTTPPQPPYYNVPPYAVVAPY